MSLDRISAVSRSSLVNIFNYIRTVPAVKPVLIVPLSDQEVELLRIYEQLKTQLRGKEVAPQKAESNESIFDEEYVISQYAKDINNPIESKEKLLADALLLQSMLAQKIERRAAKLDRYDSEKARLIASIEAKKQKIAEIEALRQGYDPKVQKVEIVEDKILEIKHRIDFLQDFIADFLSATEIDLAQYPQIDLSPCNPERVYVHKGL